MFEQLDGYKDFIIFIYALICSEKYQELDLLIYLLEKLQRNLSKQLTHKLSNKENWKLGLIIELLKISKHELIEKNPEMDE